VSRQPGSRDSSTNKPEITNRSCRGVTRSSAAARQFPGAEQPDEHNGDEQHNGDEKHLPGAAEKVSHDVRPVMRARRPSRLSLPGAPGSQMNAGGTACNHRYPERQPAYDAFRGARHVIIEDRDGKPGGLMSPIGAEPRHQPPTPPPSGTSRRSFAARSA
jgi:hypothetical protein